jgi:hypothetical protein
MRDNATQIGWFHLRNDKEFTNTYECAAWYENVMVKAGRYPVMVYDYRLQERKEGREVDGFIGSAYTYLSGIITSDYFGALFCGVPVGHYDGSKNIGKEGSHSMHSYLYSIASSILNEPDSPWELFPEYEAKEIHFISCIDGRECKTHGIFVVNQST